MQIGNRIQIWLCRVRIRIQADPDSKELLAGRGSIWILANLIHLCDEAGLGHVPLDIGDLAQHPLVVHLK
jgi:hypothetical protein